MTDSPTTYRLSLAVDAWLNAEAERLGVSKNSVVEMKLSALMTSESQPFTAAQYDEIQRLIEQALILNRMNEQQYTRDLEILSKMKVPDQTPSPYLPGKDDLS